MNANMNSKHQKPLVEATNLKTWFPIRRGVLSRTIGYVRAVDDVSFTIYKGETMGLVGESGCGKTTLGRTLVGLEKSHDGAIRFDGQNLNTLSRQEFRELRSRIQIIFQDPLSSLNPRMNVADIVTEGISEFGLMNGDREAAARQILKDVGLDTDSLYRYPHEFSGGQRQRINIARAVSLKPDFIVCDEPVSALDVSIQAQIINLLLELRQKYHLAYLFISHDLSVVSHIANRIAVMYLGRLVEAGNTRDIIFDAKHPYTQALIAAVPRPGTQRESRPVLKGNTPSPSAPPKGCRFHPRCPKVMRVCRREDPKELNVGGHMVCCHLYS
jgi:oligopeptide/dipeptide ABC transporter ATP-binding protein